jgi:hypothetical protein
MRGIASRSKDSERCQNPKRGEPVHGDVGWLAERRFEL